MYKSEHLAKENIQIVNKHIKNTQNHISLGNCKLKQQLSSTAYLLDPVNSKKRGGGRGFSGGSVVKNLPDNARDSSSISYPEEPTSHRETQLYFSTAKQGSPVN